MSSSDSVNSIMINHLILQIHDNLDLLFKLNQINSHNLDLIKATLPNSTSSTSSIQSSHSNSIPPQTQTQTQTQPPPPPSHHPSSSFPITPSAPNRELPSQYKQARALWAYNGSAPDDLTFQKGDLIIILAEENQDWWRGQLLNSSKSSGLFPSNHVELISLPPVHPPHPPQHNHSSFSYPTQPLPINTGYQNPGYALAINYSDVKSSQIPPPPPPLQYSQTAPPQPVNITVEKPKKNMLQGRFGQALAGGAGFGAGSAVATHVVNAIL